MKDNDQAASWNSHDFLVMLCVGTVIQLVKFAHCLAPIFQYGTFITTTLCMLTLHITVLLPLFLSIQIMRWFMYGFLRLLLRGLLFSTGLLSGVLTWCLFTIVIDPFCACVPYKKVLDSTTPSTRLFPPNIGKNPRHSSGLGPIIICRRSNLFAKRSIRHARGCQSQKAHNRYYNMTQPRVS